MKSESGFSLAMASQPFALKLSMNVMKHQNSGFFHVKNIYWE